VSGREAQCDCKGEMSNLQVRLLMFFWGVVGIFVSLAS
jgi:hypothetical protein